MPELLQGFVILLFSGQKFMSIQSSIGCHVEAISASLDHVPDSQCPDRQIRMFVLEHLSGGFSHRKEKPSYAASSAISPISAFILGLFASVVLVNSSIVIEYFAMTATANKSNHLSHSISGDLVLSDQNSGRPGNKEGVYCSAVFFRRRCIDAVEVSRSAMLKTTERQCTRRKEEEITMYYELYLEVKATATKHSVLHFILAFS